LNLKFGLAKPEKQAKPKSNIKPSQNQAKIKPSQFQSNLLNFQHDQAKLNPSIQNWLALTRSALECNHHYFCYSGADYTDK
jgi:outer membrane protein OmpA-like peptidoglycan-associated protein